MGWVYSHKFFCALSKPLTYVANNLVDMELPVPTNGRHIQYFHHWITPLPHMREILTHIYYYRDDVISVVQGGTGRQHRVFDVTLRNLKWILPSLP